LPPGRGGDRQQFHPEPSAVAVAPRLNDIPDDGTPSFGAVPGPGRRCPLFVKGPPAAGAHLNSAADARATAGQEWCAETAPASDSGPRGVGVGTSLLTIPNDDLPQLGSREELEEVFLDELGIRILGVEDVPLLSRSLLATTGMDP
jgi:hypothetical protein